MFRLRKGNKNRKQYAYSANQRHMNTQNQGTVSLFNKSYSDFSPPVLVFNSFQILTHFTLTISPYGWCYYCLHFTD